jgi:RNA polymerase sigma-70 factor (ECF subfamily)
VNNTYQLGPLLDRSRAADAEAFNELLARLRPYVRLLVHRRLGTRLRPKVDDSDLVQEILLRVHGGFGRFAGQEVPQLLAWVGQIAGHVVADCERRHGADRRDVAREVHGSDLMGRFLAADSTPAERLARAEEAARLAAALERLPEAQRYVLQARFFDQLPFDEISRRTGKTAGALRVVCVRAVERLRRELEAGT